MRTRLKQLAIAAAGAAILVLVFFAYLRPSFIVDLANRFILCF